MKVINEELGGIAGRPLRLEFCETTTGESERACAETLVAKNVDMVLTGLTPVDPGAMTTSLGELPVTGIDPRSVEEERNNNAAYYVLGRRGVLETAVTWVARNTEGAVLFVTDGESGEAELLEDASKRLRDAGRRSTTARLEPAGEGTTGKALENALENSGATVLVVNTGAAGCITVAETLRARSEEVRVITHGSCSQRQVHDTLGDWSRNWVHIAGGPDLSKYDEDLEAGYYRARFEADHPDGDWTAWASLTFSAIMNTTKAINLAVDTSGPGIVRALRELSGEGYASQGPLRCDRVPQRPALCLHTARLYTYDGKRAWQPAETDPLIDIHP